MIIGELCFRVGNDVLPSFVVDCSGNLVRCALDSHRAGELIKGAFELVSTAEELANPLAWTITIDRIEDRLASLISLMPQLRRAYPRLKVQVSEFPFAPKAKTTEPDVTVIEAIDFIAKHGDIESAEVIEYLSTIGVVRIPRIHSFNAAIHEPADGAIPGDTVETLADGWFSSMKIFRKSVVR